MHLVDDEHTVFAVRRRYLNLFHEALDVLHTVVGGCGELDNVQRAVFIELPAGIALVARFAIGRAVGAVDGFGENTGTRRLAHAA